MLPAGVGTAADVLEDMLAKGLGQAYGGLKGLGSAGLSGGPEGLHRRHSSAPSSLLDSSRRARLNVASALSGSPSMPTT